MKKRETNPTHPIRRINLSLPIVRTDAYEIYYTVPPAPTRQTSPNARTIVGQKPVIDTNKLNNQKTKGRTPGRLKRTTAPVLVNLIVGMPSIPKNAPLTMVDTISNALINSGYSGEVLRAVPSMARCKKRQITKNDGAQSESSSDDKFLYESVESFEDPLINKTKNGMWHNVHYPKLTTMKVLHKRRTSRRILGPNDVDLRAPNTSSLGHLSQESAVSSNERLYEKIEQLTRSYFPTIQQLRHCHPCPELINNRMHLHREEKRDFIPILPRPRVVR